MDLEEGKTKTKKEGRLGSGVDLIQKLLFWVRMWGEKSQNQLSFLIVYLSFYIYIYIFMWATTFLLSAD